MTARPSTTMNFSTFVWCQWLPRVMPGLVRETKICPNGGDLMSSASQPRLSIALLRLVCKPSVGRYETYVAYSGRVERVGKVRQHAACHGCRGRPRSVSRQLPQGDAERRAPRQVTRRGGLARPAPSGTPPPGRRCRASSSSRSGSLTWMGKPRAMLWQNVATTEL